MTTMARMPNPTHHSRSPQRQVEPGQQHHGSRRSDDQPADAILHAVKEREVARVGAAGDRDDDRIGEHDTEGDDHRRDVDRLDDRVDGHDGAAA
jgi:hypothetical protein